MDLKEYIEMFKDGGVKAMLDWDALRDMDCAVSAVYSRSRDLLSSIFTVWYERPDGTNGDWRNRTDRPLRVGDVYRTHSTWPEVRRRRIAALSDTFRREPEPVQLVLPAYSLGDERLLLLDGTHRSVAAHLAGADVRLFIFMVKGPVDDKILPDLMHF
ncbi:hypothetical protein [Planobispora rosea]|uniref:hypothetical protein n=1 Tax=Planobispora rosea TaxID=35762 RepID=UPI00083AA01E|nr:hypothetical protein [Planobispora rosea]